MFKSSVLQIVAKSPFKLLQKHMRKAYKAVSLLEPFLQASLVEDWVEAKSVFQQISRYESRADSLKIEVCNNLHQGVLLPVSKGQVLSLVTYQDELANLAEDLAGLIYGRKMQFSSVLHDEMLAYMQSAICACNQAEKTIAELSQILESGFSGAMQGLTESMISELDSLESQNDKLQIELRRKIFAIEADLPPLDAIFLYAVIEKIGHLADGAQKVGMQLLMLVSR
jgi:predicted phosphate transport protein (TIGR00153 family)